MTVDGVSSWIFSQRLIPWLRFVCGCVLLCAWGVWCRSRGWYTVVGADQDGDDGDGGVALGEAFGDGGVKNGECELEKLIDNEIPEDCDE